MGCEVNDYASEGGKARAAKLTAEDRQEIAAAGAQARCAKADPSRETLPKAICGSTDKPLVIGNLQLPCYVLNDERRVLTLTGMSRALSMAVGGSMVKGLNRLELFISRDRIKPFVSKDLADSIHSPIIFITPSGGKAYGYKAEVLGELCEAVLAAREAGVLQAQQVGIAHSCEVLMRGFAKVGIIALIDEITGYQYQRDRGELHRILSLYLTDERLGWAKKFPDEYFKHLARLWGWTWPCPAGQTPRYVGHLTNRLVYDKLPPGVLDELKKKNPIGDETGRRKYRHHQFLTEDFGQPDLRDHILQLVAIMRVSRDRETFEENFAAAFPAPGDQLRLLDDVEYKKSETAGEAA
jgi:hypothetical protein